MAGSHASLSFPPQELRDEFGLDATIATKIWTRIEAEKLKMSQSQIEEALFTAPPVGKRGGSRRRSSIPTAAEPVPLDAAGGGAASTLPILPSSKRTRRNNNLSAAPAAAHGDDDAPMEEGEEEALAAPPVPFFIDIDDSSDGPEAMAVYEAGPSEPSIPLAGTRGKRSLGRKPKAGVSIPPVIAIPSSNTQVRTSHTFHSYFTLLPFPRPCIQTTCSFSESLSF